MVRAVIGSSCPVMRPGESAVSCSIAAAIVGMEGEVGGVAGGSMVGGEEAEAEPSLLMAGGRWGGVGDGGGRVEGVCLCAVHVNIVGTTNGRPVVVRAIYS